MIRSQGDNVTAFPESTCDIGNRQTVQKSIQTKLYTSQYRISLV